MKIKEQDYIPAFDGLRAFAVLLVLFFHWEFPLLNIPFGWVGVQIFFVLSGFLITGILLHAKEKSFSLYLRDFYVRRMLRIFPLYFFYLLVCIIIISIFRNSNILYFIDAMRDLKLNALMLLTYTYNFQEIINFFAGNLYSSSYFFGHLWSLSVEEQFYLLFPLLVYFAGRKMLKAVLITIICGAPLLRLVSYFYLNEISNDAIFNGLVINRLTFFQADSLACGAALAVFNFQNIKSASRLFIIALIIVIAVGTINNLYLYGNDFGFFRLKSFGFENAKFLTSAYRSIYYYTLINIVSALFLLSVLNGKKIKVLENRHVRYLGKISYGIYIWHLILILPFFVIYDGFKTGNKFYNSLIELVLCLAYVSVVIFISHLSYKYFEMHFLRIKNRVTSR